MWYSETRTISRAHHSCSISYHTLTRYITNTVIQEHIPEYGLLNKQNCATSLFDLFTYVQNVLPLLTEDAVHLRVVWYYHLVLHLKYRGTCTCICMTLIIHKMLRKTRQGKATQHNRKTKQHNTTRPKQFIVHVHRSLYIAHVHVTPAGSNTTLFAL